MDLCDARKLRHLHDGHHMKAVPPARGQHGRELRFLLVSRDTGLTSDLHPDPHFLQPPVVLFQHPPEESTRTSKTQVTSTFKHPPDPFQVSNLSIALKHQALTAWGWGYEAAAPGSFCENGLGWGEEPLTPESVFCFL